MLKSFSPGAWKFPGFLTLPEEPESFPAPLRRAVRLMLAGAAVTVVWGLYVAVVTGVNANYMVTPQGKITRIGGAELAVSIVVMVVFTLVFAALWLLMARLTRQGRNAARLTSSVLFFFWSVMSYLYLGSVTEGPAILAEVVLVLVIWAIGLASVFLLWRPESSERFRR
ncbi:MAG: hypothetical protein FWE35_02215 [Streptosporangiales bacterium]|nr:hypothetical protein [Streptosporangiales bacterium]